MQTTDLLAGAKNDKWSTLRARSQARKKRRRTTTLVLGLSLLSAASAWGQTITARPEAPWNGGGTSFYQEGQYLGRAVPAQPWNGGGTELYGSGGQFLGRVVPAEPWNGGGSTFSEPGYRDWGEPYGYRGTFQGR